MNSEIQAASTFLSTFLPPSTSQSFIQSLQSLLYTRYHSHWHPNDPEKGSAYRALIRSGSNLDASLLLAATQCGMSKSDLSRALGGAEGKIWLGLGWTLWVDPGCVSLRIERNGVVGGAPGQGREGQFIEIYGKLPESLSSHAVLLENVEGPATAISIISPPISSISHSTTTPTFTSRDLPLSTSISPPVQDYNLLSPGAKRSSRAIQILRPPMIENRSTFSLQPLSPPSTLASAALLPSHNISHVFASPRVTPPTPARPSSPSSLDVFSPSPKPTSASNLTLSAPDPRSLHQHRRSTSTGSVSSISSIGSNRRGSGSVGSGSDAESDGIFSSSESMSSSFTSAGTSNKLWSGNGNRGEGGEYRMAPLPGRNGSAGNFAFPTNGNDNSFNPPRSHSSHSNRSQHSSPSKSGSQQYPRSVPNSPTKSRRRGQRGGSVSTSSTSLFPSTATSSHEHNSSITSMSSITSRTREQALLGTLTEHSGGKVGVLGGGVLLGLAAGTSKAGAKMSGAMAGERRRNVSGGSSGSRGERRRIQPVSIPFPTHGATLGGGYGIF